MTTQNSSSKREAILSRVTREVDVETLIGATGPLTWDDIGFVAQGLVFGSRPVHQATQPATEAYDLGPRGAWMLNLIAGGVVYPHELSEVLCIGRSLVSAELVRLTDAGLVESTPGKTDRRRTELALTAQGQTVRDQIREEIHRSISEPLAKYTPDQVRLLARMLQDLRNAANR